MPITLPVVAGFPGSFCCGHTSVPSLAPPQSWPPVPLATQSLSRLEIDTKGLRPVTVNAGKEAGKVAGKAAGKVEEAGDSRSLEWLARVGLIAYGVVHVLVGWLALQIAWGSASSGGADSSGALKAVAAQPFGRIMLWLLAVGLVALALWQASEAVWDRRTGRGIRRVLARVTAGAKAVVYAGLGISAASVALGSGSSNSQSQQHATSGVLGWPGGQVIVVAAGLAIIGVGVANVVKGVRRSFAEEIDTSSMSPAAGKATLVVGQVGYIAKGLALVLVGGLVGFAALTFDPARSQGLDGALQTILSAPFGRFLLTAVALGFVAFGVFAVLQSWYRRM